MKPKKTHISKNGKYQTGFSRGRKRKQWDPLILILSLIVVLLLAVNVIMLTMVREQKQFDDLAAMVHSEETHPPTTVSASEPITIESTAEETTLPIETTAAATEPQPLSQYQALYEQNDEFYGWLKIDETKIDYPVMYTPQEPEKYLHRDFEGKDSYGGVPFLEDECSPDSDNLIIYGHNMANGTMFRDLIQYEKQAFWEKHPVIRFDTLYEEQTFEVVAAFYDRVYLKTEDVFKFYQFVDAEDQADFDNAVGQFRKKSIYDTGIIPEYGDQLITLVTCAYHTENGRFVVVARRISDTPEPIISNPPVQAPTPTLSKEPSSAQAQIQIQEEDMASLLS